MSNASQQIVNKAWNFAHVLRDDGLSYMAYTEQITFLLFLKMAHEQTLPPYNRPPIVPPELGWPSLLAKDGDDLEVHYRHVLEELGKKRGMLGEVFKKARQEIQNPATLKRLIVDLIEPEQWMAHAGRREGRHLRRSACQERGGIAQRGRPVLHAARADQGDRRRDAAEGQTTRSAIRPAAPADSCWPRTIT